MEQNLNFFLAITGRLDWLGNWLFLLIALTECVPFFGAFFPGGALISIGAFFAAQGIFNVWGLTAFAIIGAILGDYAGYSLGRWGGKWLERKGLVKTAWIAKGEEFFKKHGNKGLLWGRFFGATRAVVPFVAGASKMKQSSFLFWNVLSALIWAAWNIGLGYFSGNLIAVIIEKWSSKLGVGLSLLAVIALVYLTIKKHGKSYWQYFKYSSLTFAERLTANPWIQALSRRDPVVPEILGVKKSQERIFAGFWILISLIVLYLLTMALDLFPAAN